MSQQQEKNKAGWGCLYLLIIVGFAINLFSLIIHQGSVFWTILFGIAVFFMVRHAKKNDQVTK